jgi:methyltransferase (TIGR00027 family)
MNQRSASRTAMLVSALRARASARPQPLCRDPWAAQLAGDVGMALADRHHEVYPASELWIALRTAWIDGRIGRLCKPLGERTQVVLLGAGLDTRSARLGGDGLRWFEVDHPASQALKVELLGELDGYPQGTATFVRCDFETDDFIERLTEAGFDPEKPALFVWEGVTPYLSEAAVRDTVHRIASSCHPDTVLIYDHLEKKLVRGTPVDMADAALKEMVDQLGEPFVFGIDDPLPLMVEEGYRQVRRVSFDEICLALTGTYERDRKFRFQHIVEASRNQLHSSW